MKYQTIEKLSFSEGNDNQAFYELLNEGDNTKKILDDAPERIQDSMLLREV